MKKIYFLAIVLCFFIKANAQVSIDAKHNLLENDVISTSNNDNTVTAVDLNTFFPIPTCRSHDISVSNYCSATAGIKPDSIDLDPLTDGIQTTFNLIVNQQTVGLFSTKDGSVYLSFNQYFDFFNNNNSSFLVNYTIKDNLGQTSNIAKCEFFSAFYAFPPTLTNPTCDYPTTGSIILAFYEPVSFMLLKDGIFFGYYPTEGGSTNFYNINNLSVGNYRIQDLSLICGIRDIPYPYAGFEISFENPLSGMGSGEYVDYNNDGIVNVGDVIKQQYSVTNNSKTCSLAEVSINPDFNFNITSQPISLLNPNETNNNIITGTQVITQNDINLGKVTRQKYFIAKDIISPNANNNYFNIETQLNISSGIRLNAFIDNNSNGKQDSNEQNFIYGSFSYSINGGVVHNLNSSNGSVYLYETNETNNYSFNYVINSDIANQYSIVTTSYSNITVANRSGIRTLNFALTPIPYNDIQVLILPSESPRPGFIYNNKIAIRNNGNKTIDSGTISFTNDSLVTIDSLYPPPSTTSAKGFTYNFNYLYPYQTIYITVSMKVPTIPTIQLGQLLTNTVTIIKPMSDDLILNDNYSLTQTVVGSYDPNEKIESHGGKVLHSSFTDKDYLTYTILFENTGTAEAINIKVEDVLDSKLDETTLKMFGSSSDYVLDRVGSNLKWSFNGINLPPSKGSETIGHGSITFQIKPKPGYAVGDIISNTAFIYFDFNPAIVTKACLTEFVKPVILSNNELNLNEFSLYPSPVANILNISSKNNIEVGSINIYNTLGQLVLVIPNAKNTKTVDVSNLTSGNYFVKINSDKGTSNTKFVKN
jgi:hypothetical protein